MGYLLSGSDPTLSLYLGVALLFYRLGASDRDHDAHFGISCPLWDFVFRTHKVRARGGGG